jgi:hypothetical protein
VLDTLLGSGLANLDLGRRERRVHKLIVAKAEGD